MVFQNSLGVLENRISSEMDVRSAGLHRNTETISIQSSRPNQSKVILFEVFRPTVKRRASLTLTLFLTDKWAQLFPYTI